MVVWGEDRVVLPTVHICLLELGAEAAAVMRVSDYLRFVSQA
jgi:hypothetical protein